jgi:hypothetical protein
MHSRLLDAALIVLLAATNVAHAQTVFVAPTTNTVTGRTEEGMGFGQAHVLYVTNLSTVPVVVFGVVLRDCENIRQSCDGRRVHITIAAGQQREVGRVSAHDESRAFSYRWTFSFEADSSDAAVLAILREHGLDLHGRPVPTAAVSDAHMDTTLFAAAMRNALPAIVPTPIRIVTTASPDLPGERPSDAPIAYHFKVFYGSILGSTMMPGAPIQPTGPCINPATLKKYEHDATIARTPWRPPVPPSNLGALSLGIPRDTVPYSGEALMRWAADTTGATIPESVSVLESSDPKLSVGLCKAVISTIVTPARDRSGHLISAWVQLPVTVHRVVQPSRGRP